MINKNYLHLSVLLWNKWKVLYAVYLRILQMNILYWPAVSHESQKFSLNTLLPLSSLKIQADLKPL
jgi:hypothetical protein